MKKSMFALAAVAAVIGLSGCSGASAEDQYVEFVKSEVPETAEMTDSQRDELIAGGHSMCDAADEQGPGAVIMAAGLGSLGEAEETQNALVAIVSGAFKHLCPEHLPALEEMGENMGGEK